MQLTRRSLILTTLSTCASSQFSLSRALGAPQGRIMTACFSRTGNTATVANHILELIGGDQFEIVPAQAYPQDYEQTVEQARRERARNYRPSLARQSNQIGDYDVVLLGYPIWAMTLPPVMRTFLEDHDLSGKTVMPFCTHKGYGRGESMRLIQSMAPRARVLDGFDVEGVDAGSARPRVEQWLRTVGLART